MFGNKNKLSFLRQYTYDDSYSECEKFRKCSIEKMVRKFNKEAQPEDNISILSVFNGINYPIFDLDTQEHYDLFKKINQELPYVMFRSSEGHYWGISGVPYKKIKTLLLDHAWKACNDEKYVKFCIHHNIQIIRGLYENFERLPYEYERNGEISENLELFIKKVKEYYKNEGFELSLSKFKDSELLEEMEVRRRKDKIERIRNHGNR